MGLSPVQRHTGNVAAMYGYKNIHEDTLPASSFSEGDGVIVLTHKGEPIMSGQVSEVRPDVGMDGGAIRVEDVWYYADQYRFRAI